MRRSRVNSGILAVRRSWVNSGVLDTRALTSRSINFMAVDNVLQLIFSVFLFLPRYHGYVSKKYILIKVPENLWYRKIIHLADFYNQNGIFQVNCF